MVNSNHNTSNTHCKSDGRYIHRHDNHTNKVQQGRHPSDVYKDNDYTKALVSGNELCTNMGGQFNMSHIDPKVFDSI